MPGGLSLYREFVPVFSILNASDVSVLIFLSLSFNRATC